MNGRNTASYLSALLTIIIWGTTFISTKILLVDFQPIEILFFRFAMGLLALFVVYLQPLKGMNRRQKLTFAAAGLCGICLYYLLENIALTCTVASNVGAIIFVAPFFTAILSLLFLKEEKSHASFFHWLCSRNGRDRSDQLQRLQAGAKPCRGFAGAAGRVDLGLLFCADKDNQRIRLPHHSRHPAGGILFMIPTLFLFDFKLELTRFTSLVYLFNILFLGVGASALCFVTWNFVVKALGAVKTSVYIYMVPVITVVTSVAILHEKITVLAATGTVLTLAGLFLSESKLFLRKEAK